MLKKRTIWFDLSTVVKFHKNIVGIVRTEKELAVNLYRLLVSDNLYEIKFCYWGGDGFVDITNAVRKFIDEGECGGNWHVKLAELLLRGHNETTNKNDKNTKENLQLILPLIGKRQILKYLVQIFLSIAPNKIRPVVNKFFIYGRDHIYLSLAKAYSHYKAGKKLKELAVRNILSETEKGALSVVFNKNDILISLGLGWEFEFWNKLPKIIDEYGIKFVSFCYDLIPINFPQYAVDKTRKLFPEYLLNLCESSSLILCDSKEAQCDLNEYIEDTGARIAPTEVVTLGDSFVDNATNNSGNVNISRDISPFILFVSTIEPRKNHRLLYDVCRELVKEHGAENVPTFVFVGRKGWAVSDLLSEIKLDPLVKGKIHILMNASDSDLIDLYRHALFCVYPSKVEGWGLPVREALYFGKLVIASDIASLRESGGGNCIYIDPTNLSSWKETIFKLASSNSERKIYEDKIRNNFHAVQWADTAKQVMTLITTRIKD